MALAKVWNDCTTEFDANGNKVPAKPYVEKFKDEVITIEPGKHIVMDKFDAIQFAGQYIPPRKNGRGDFVNHKMIRVEVIPDEVPAVVEIKCQMCLGKFDTDKELALHSEAHHKADMVPDTKKK